MHYFSVFHEEDLARCIILRISWMIRWSCKKDFLSPASYCVLSLGSVI